MWVGGFLIIGAGAHASIFIIGDMLHYYSRCSCCILQQVLNHRDVIIAHLIWVSIALGLHSFSLYIHNDTIHKPLGVQKISFMIIIVHLFN